MRAPHAADRIDPVIVVEPAHGGACRVRLSGSGLVDVATLHPHAIAALDAALRLQRRYGAKLVDLTE